MHLWNIDKKGVYFRGHEMLEGVYFPVNTLNSTWVEFCVGTEFILKDLPNVYIGLGLLTISGAESGGKILAGRDESTEFEGTYDMNNDSVQDIPAQIYGFLGSGGKVGGDSIAKCIYCNLNLGEKICTVLNESDSELYIDILHVGDERLMSIFSSMLDWVSWMSVPSHSERSFWFTGDYKLSDKFLLVGSRKGLPLNGIFKFYRPGVKYKEHFLGIKLILVQVR